MRLRKIAIRGLTRFMSPQPVSIDLDDHGQLVALVGPNGAGKTTLLEAVAAALYKALPSRPGSLYEHAHGRDAFVEAVFDDHGSEVKVRVQVDAERRTTEGYVFVDGASVTTGRAAEFQAEIEKRFGSLELFLASAFSAQNRQGNFLLMAKGDRKALFVELLGLSKLEVLHEGAKARRSGAEAEQYGARALVQAAEAEIAALPQEEGRLQVAQNAADAAAHALEVARTEEAAAVATLERARSVSARLNALEQAAGAARRELASAEVAVSEAQGLAPRARAEADRRRRALEAQDLGGQETRARERHERAIQAIVVRRRSAESTVADAPEIERAVGRLPALKRERDELAASETKGKDLERAVSAAGVNLRASEHRLQDAQSTAARERVRLTRQAGLLGEVPCTSSSSWVPYESVLDPTPLREKVTSDLARLCPLLADAREAAEAAPHVAVDPSIAKGVETQQRALEQAAADHQDAILACDPIRLHELQAEISKAEVLAGRTPLLEEARRQLETLEAEWDTADAEHVAELKRIQASRDSAAEAGREIERDLQLALADAEAKVRAACDSRAAAKARLAKANGDLADARKDGTLSVPHAEASLSSARQTRIAGEGNLRRADQERAGIEGKVNALREKAAGLDGLRDSFARAQQEVGDWLLLEKALGRDGVQALEIDAAGPEVARICNELLEACYGPRFSISFETLREKRSARGEFSEAFDVRVFDQGHERAVEALSGGERVIVGEAIGLALAVFNCRKSGIRWETLWRDETAGALDAKNAARYTDMLRRALALGGFAQVLFVSHSPEVVERADSRLVVADGSIGPGGIREDVAERVPA